MDRKQARAPPCDARSPSFHEHFHFAASRTRTDLLSWSFLLVAAAVLGLAQTFQVVHPPQPEPQLGVCTQPYPGQPQSSTCAAPAQPTAPAHHLAVIYLLPCACAGTSATLLVFLSALSACLLATWLAPAWSRAGGRTLLVATARVAPRLFSLLETLLPLLLTPGKHASGGPAPGACLPVPATSTGGAVGLLITALYFPVPFKAQLLISTAEAALLLAYDALTAPLAAPAGPHLAHLALHTALIGVLLPTLLLAFYEHALRPQPRCGPSDDPHCSPQGDPHSSPDSQQHTQQNDEHLSSVPPGSRQYSGDPAFPPQAPAAVTNATPAAPRGPFTPVSQNRRAVAGKAPAARRTLYSSRMRTCTVSVKIHHHSAYAHRKQLSAAVESSLSTLCRHPTPAEGIVHCAPGTPKRPPAATPHILSSVAIKGCLHILTNIHQPVGAPLPPLHPPALTPRVLAALPHPFDQAATTICAANHIEASPHSHAPAIQLHPPCAEAGSQCPQEVLLTVPGAVLSGLPLSGGLCDDQQACMEAVLQCWQGGRPLVLRQQLVQEATADDNPTFRILLPAGLDAAPVELHLLAACPGLQATLLGATTTMALPGAVAHELTSTASLCTGRAQAVAALLSDWAALWQFQSRVADGGLPDATEAEVLEEMGRWLAANGCTACSGLLQQQQNQHRVARSPPLLQQQQPHLQCLQASSPLPKPHSRATSSTAGSPAVTTIPDRGTPTTPIPPTFLLSPCSPDLACSSSSPCHAMPPLHAWLPSSLLTVR